MIDDNSPKFLKGEETSLQEGGLYFISHQNGRKLGTHLLIDANDRGKKGGGGVKKYLT